MPSLISADAWPVFEEYAIERGPDGEKHVRPAEGAEIRERIDLMSPATRHDALTAAIRLVKWNEPDALSKSLAQAMGLGDLNRRELLAYAAQYGLLGIGPSFIVRAVQHLERRTGRRHTPHHLIHRVGGQLRWQGSSGADYGPPGLTLVRPWGSPLETWRFMSRGISASDVFAHEIGSDSWWALYSEPLDEIQRAIGSLQAHASTLEPLLADTFVRLPADRSVTAAIDRSAVVMRSVSAIGALALDVMEGGLEGVRVCEYDLCRKRYLPKRSDQRFCCPSCKSSKYDRDKRLEGRPGGGER